jgi:hypothetical protein
MVGTLSLCPPYELPLRKLRRSARRLRRHVALVLHDDLVERAEIGFCRSHQRIRIGPFDVIERPSWASRTDTSACASVPSVTAWT